MASTSTSGSMGNAIGGGIQITSFVSSRSDDIAFLQAFNATTTTTSGGSNTTSRIVDNDHKRKCGQLRTTSHRKYHHRHNRRQGKHSTRKRRKVMKDEMTGICSDSIGCRRHRRRRKNLLMMHTTTSSNSDDGGDDDKVIKWLMTHIWHRKRMIMATLWGYVIPIRSSQYSVNSSMLKKGTIACDRSFVRPIQLSTKEGVDDILCVLRRFLDPSGSFLTADYYIVMIAVVDIIR